jgi:hypothetical protein
MIYLNQRSCSFLFDAPIADPNLSLLDVDIHFGSALKVVGETLHAVHSAVLRVSAVAGGTPVLLAELPTDAIPVENVTTVESYCSSVRVADAALTDAVNILFSLLPLQSVQLFISDIATTFQ